MKFVLTFKDVLFMIFMILVIICIISFGGYMIFCYISHRLEMRRLYYSCMKHKGHVTNIYLTDDNNKDDYLVFMDKNIFYVKNRNHLEYILKHYDKSDIGDFDITYYNDKED